MSISLTAHDSPEVTSTGPPHSGQAMTGMLCPAEPVPRSISFGGPSKPHFLQRSTIGSLSMTRAEPSRAVPSESTSYANRI